MLMKIDYRREVESPPKARGIHSHKASCISAWPGFGRARRIISGHWSLSICGQVQQKKSGERGCTHSMRIRCWVVCRVCRCLLARQGAACRRRRRIRLSRGRCRRIRLTGGRCRLVGGNRNGIRYRRSPRWACHGSGTDDSAWPAAQGVATTRCQDEGGQDQTNTNMARYHRSLLLPQGRLGIGWPRALRRRPTLNGRALVVGYQRYLLGSYALGWFWKLEFTGRAE